MNFCKFFVVSEGIFNLVNVLVNFIAVDFEIEPDIIVDFWSDWSWAYFELFNFLSELIEQFELKHFIDGHSFIGTKLEGSFEQDPEIWVD